MSTAELKEKLIGHINDTNDEGVLLDIYRLLEIEIGDTSIYPLNNEQISIIREVQEEVKNGKFLSDEDSNKAIDEWFEK